MNRHFKSILKVVEHSFALCCHGRAALPRRPDQWGVSSIKPFEASGGAAAPPYRDASVVGCRFRDAVNVAKPHYGGCADIGSATQMNRHFKSILKVVGVSFARCCHGRAARPRRRDFWTAATCRRFTKRGHVRALQNNRAFSLIEVMVAMLILGIALVGLIQGITTALGSSKESELQTVASLLAAGQIEELRATGGIADGETEGDCGSNLPLYRWKKTVRPGGLDGLHEVSLTIQNAQSGREIYELRTLLFETPDDPATADAGKDKGKGGKSGSKRRSRS